MEITANNVLLIVAALLFLSVLAGKAGNRFGMPALLLFLGVGMLAGVDGFGLQFDSVSAAQFIGMVSLSIILFSGGADTKFSEIRPILGPGLVLATAGVLLTTVLTGCFIYAIFHMLAPDYAFGWIESMLLAACMSSTDSASVFSILNSSGSGLKQDLKPTLELESGSNDPMAYLLVVILIGVMESGASASDPSLWLHASGQLLTQLAMGAFGGVIIGYVSVWTLRRLDSSNEFFYPVMMIACVFFTFTLTEMVHGNSYLAVYIAGLVVGNNRLPLKRTITTFFGGFTWLVQIIMFLSLGLLVNPGELGGVVVPGIAVGLFMIVLARPLTVFLCMLPFRNFSFKGKLYLSWVGLRGAVPIIFATYAVVSPAVEHGAFMFNVVFFITILSLLIQGTTVNSMARWLGLRVARAQTAFPGMEIPEDALATMREMEVSASMLEAGDQLRDMTVPDGALVVMIRRGRDYLVPKGKTRLRLGDKLLLLTEDRPSDHRR